MNKCTEHFRREYPRQCIQFRLKEASLPPPYPPSPNKKNQINENFLFAYNDKYISLKLKCN